MQKKTLYSILIIAVCITVGCEPVKGEKIKVIESYINYYDPSGKSPLNLPKNLPPSPIPNLPAVPKTISPGYHTDPQGVIAWHVYLEPGTDRLLRFALVKAFKGDTVPAFLDQKIWYQVSNDGGKTMSELRPLIQQGSEYSMLHPIKPVYCEKDKNSFVTDYGPPVRASNGEIMVPFYFPPLDANGKYYNPVKAHTFSDAGVLIGRWTADGKDIIWDLGQTIRIEADESTRGANEPTIIELKKPGHFLMVIRTSNQNRTDTVPGYKFMSVSRDYCRTWSKPVPFTYSDRTNFYSPSACSLLLRSVKNGKVYWVGNISRTPPKGNHPRYPLIIAEVDEDTLGIIKESVTTIDDRNLEIESENMQLSNFKIYQDAATGKIVIRVNRYDFKRAKQLNDKKAKHPPCFYVLEP